MPERLPNVHPGEILLEEFLRPLGISQNKLAREIKVPPRRVNEIVLGKRAITPDTALRLARYFVGSASGSGFRWTSSWKRPSERSAKSIQKEVHPLSSAA